MMEISRRVRMGLLHALGAFIAKPPVPTPTLLAPDLLIVTNWQPNRSAFYIRGADGKWRQSSAIAWGTAEGWLIVDLPTLERDYGRPLPPKVLAMARPRPLGVPKQLQTTSATIATAMASAPDPASTCRAASPSDTGKPDEEL